MTIKETMKRGEEEFTGQGFSSPEAVRNWLKQHQQDLLRAVVEEYDRLGNFWTNNGNWSVPTDNEMAADPFKAYKFGKVELLSDLKKHITNLLDSE